MSPFGLRFDGDDEDGGDDDHHGNLSTVLVAVVYLW